MWYNTCNRYRSAYPQKYTEDCESKNNQATTTTAKWHRATGRWVTGGRESAVTPQQSQWKNLNKITVYWIGACLVTAQSVCLLRWRRKRTRRRRRRGFWLEQDRSNRRAGGIKEVHFVVYHLLTWVIHVGSVAIRPNLCLLCVWTG